MGTSRVLDDAHRFAPAAPEARHVYGACAPGWHSAASRDEAIDDWLAFMQREGVERVCCLLTGHQLDRTGANVARYRDAFGGDRVLHAPILDHHLTDATHLSEVILPFLERAVEADEKVVVHCLAGLGRTGHVLAAWLVAHHDHSPARAINTVEDMGRAPEEAVQQGNATRGELLTLLDAVQ